MEKNKKQIEAQIKKLLSEDSETVITTILKYIPWPKNVETDKEYFVLQDDCDGLRSGISIFFLSNGDGEIDLNQGFTIKSEFVKEAIYQNPHYYRFRNYAGGGLKPLTYGALLMLATALVMESDEETEI